MGERHAGLVFYDNSDFNIAKSKKSEQYIHENFDEHFARHCESHWRETWHHTGTRTERPIFLETPPFLVLLFKRYSFRIFFYPMILSTMVLILLFFSSRRVTSPSCAFSRRSLHSPKYRRACLQAIFFPINCYVLMRAQLLALAQFIYFVHRGKTCCS